MGTLYEEAVRMLFFRKGRPVETTPLPQKERREKQVICAKRVLLDQPEVKHKFSVFLENI